MWQLLRKIQSSPLTGELKNKNYTLSELFLNTFSNHVNNIIRHKVSCSKRGCGGVRLSIFEKSQIILEDKVLKLVCPSATRWLSHEHCFSRIIEVYEAALTALSHLYEDRGDVDALGLLIQLSDPKFVLTALMLVDMLGIISHLTLWLQSSPATADVTQLPLMVEHVVKRLNYISSVGASQMSKFTVWNH